MNDSLTEDYLRWLEPQIRDEYGNPNRSYSDLVQAMYEREFVVHIVHGDSDRVGDGMDLRKEYVHEMAFPPHRRDRLFRVLGPCSFLEVLIGLSRRLAFDAGGQAPGWAWQLLHNLEVHRMADPMRRSQHRQLDGIMETVIFRTYQPNGGGGFFPLIGSDEDQRQVELCYQMAAYIDEIHPEH